jgi:hypothetical protein
MKRHPTKAPNNTTIWGQLFLLLYLYGILLFLGLEVPAVYARKWGDITPERTGKGKRQGRESLTHAGHEASAEWCYGLWKYGVELVHNVDDGDDTLVVAEGEAAERGEAGCAANIRRGHKALDAIGAVGDIAGEDSFGGLTSGRGN